MLDAFLAGLKNRKISEQIILHENAHTAEEAMVLAGRYSGAEERLKRLHLIHREMPMEINSVLKTDDPTEPAISQVRKEVTQITSKIAKLEAQLKQSPIASISPNDKKTGPKSKHQKKRPPQCGFCRRVGHTEAECRTKTRQQYRSQGSCFTCGKMGHFARECRLTTNYQPRYPQRPANYQPSPFQSSIRPTTSVNGQWGPSFQ